MDEGNQRVLVLVEKLGSGARRRKIAFVAGLVFAAIGIGGVGYAIFGHGPNDPDTGHEGPALATIGPLASEAPDAGRATPVKRDAGPARRDAGPARRDAGIRIAVLPNPTTKVRQPSNGTDTPGGLREVQFAFNPPNVSLGIDGSEPRPVGPSYRTASLSTGTHRFRLVANPYPGANSAFRCCEDADWVETITAGEGPYQLRRTLSPNPARIRIVSNVPGRVAVDGVRADGRTGEIITVPMSNPRAEQVPVSVRADGFRLWQGRIGISPALLTERTITLEPDTEPTPDPAPDPEPAPP
jgi:hypothetical protein